MGARAARPCSSLRAIHAKHPFMEWRLEAAMVGKDGFPAVVMRLESRICDSWLPGGSHPMAHHRRTGIHACLPTQFLNIDEILGSGGCPLVANEILLADELEMNPLPFHLDPA